MESEPPLLQPPRAKPEYMVIPFVAKIGINAGADEAAAQLALLIDEWTNSGWDYVRLESVETHIAGNNGCFGIGATPPRVISCSMAVFRR